MADTDPVLLAPEERAVLRRIAEGEPLGAVARALTVPVDEVQRRLRAALAAVTAALDGTEAVTTIQLFGPFRVARGAVDATPPAGRPATVVQLVALNGGRLHAEEVIEHLWPASDPTTGRTRLRNVLARLRRASGDVVVRDGDALTLAPGVRVDLAEFDEAARAALSSQGPDAADAARRALAVAGGELLPDARYESWADRHREAVRLRQLDLLGALADHERSHGRIEAALAHLDRALDLDPLDEGRYLEAIAWLEAVGRQRDVRRIVHRARVEWASVGLEPSLRLGADTGDPVSAPR